MQGCVSGQGCKTSEVRVQRTIFELEEGHPQGARPDPWLDPRVVHRGWRLPGDPGPGQGRPRAGEHRKHHPCCFLKGFAYGTNG